jgi:2-polyprenyl-3-methyl-5-hydroxy-6-metoxy-1,4-benzoquinol methylase
MSDESEVKKLKSRGGRAYSLGHQRMYRATAELLGQAGADLFEVGTGIGYGFEVLKDAAAFKRYRGIDPDPQCVEYVKSKYDLQIQCATIEEHDLPGNLDAITFIEVIEHISLDKHEWILEKLLMGLRPGGTLFMSTPDKNRHRHGTTTPETLLDQLGEAGFIASVSRFQWTDFYLCTKPW